MIDDWEHNPRTPRRLPLDFGPLRRDVGCGRHRAKLFLAGIVLLATLCASLATLHP